MADVGPETLFGRVAVSAGYLTEIQVQRLLDAQASGRAEGRASTLGELAQEQGLMTSQQVQRTLLVQEFSEMRDEDKRLGALAVSNAFATQEQVDRALEEQQQEYQRTSRVPRRLGEILVSRSLLSAQQLEALLGAQARVATGGTPAPLPKPPAPEDLTGSLAIEGGKTIPIGKKAILGRLSTCDVFLAEPRASRQHARILLDPNSRQHVLTDLNTPNGTLVNGERIKGNVVLRPGDRIQIGLTTLRYEASAQTAYTGTDLDTTMADLSDVRAQAEALLEARHDTVHMSPPIPRQPTRPPTRLIRAVPASAPSPAPSAPKPKQPPVEDDFLGLGATPPTPPAQPAADDFLGLGTAPTAPAPASSTNDEDFLGLGEVAGPPSPPASDDFLGLGGSAPASKSGDEADDDFLGLGGPDRPRPGPRNAPPDKIPFSRQARRRGKT